MESVADAASLLSDPTSSFEGTATLSVETREGGDDGGIVSFVVAAPETFLKFAALLPPRAQDLLLVYLLLNREQNSLAIIFKNTQTVSSFEIRRAVAALAAFVFFNGDPSVAVMREILKSEGLEVSDFAGFTKPGQVFSMAELLSEFVASGSFFVVARSRKIHRPALRRAFKNLSETLAGSKRHASLALASYIRLKTEKKSPTGVGETPTARSKQKDVHLTDSSIVNSFVIDVQDPRLHEIFVPKRAL
jgi:hypothetical protein